MTSVQGKSALFTVDDFVQVDAATEPTFSADGKSVVFLSDRSGIRQAYSVGLDGETSLEARRLTATEGLVYHADARPGHNEALFVTDDGGDEQYQVNLVQLQSGSVETKEIASSPKVINTYGFWSSDGRLLSLGSNRREQRFSDIYVLDLATESERLVLQEDSPMIRAGAFSPDGTKLICSWPNLALAGDNDLYVIDLNSPGSRTKITEHTGSAQWPSSLREAPTACFISDDVILARSDEAREFIGLQRIELSTGVRQYVLTPDWDVEAFDVSADRSRIAVVINEDGYSRLVLHELSSDGTLGVALSVPELPAGQIAGPNWNPDSNAVTFSLEGPLNPSTIWLVDLLSGTARELTRSKMAALPESALAEPELIRYTSFDGREIPAFFYRPPARSSDEPMPCVVLVHGGPESQSRPSLWGRYAAAAYLLAKNEVCLLVPNVRGSTGYGKEYSHADDVEKRMDSVADLIASLDWLKASGEVDPERIGVMGGSYGGFMTLAAITEAPDKWAAAVDMFGIANWETFFEHTGSWRKEQRAREYGSDPAFLRSISPIYKADEISAALMVIQGDHDVRVPPEESEQIADAVRRNEGVVEHVVFEREGHGIQRLPNRLRMNQMIVDFLSVHLVGAKK